MAVFFFCASIYRLDFSLTEDEDNNTIVLDLAVYRYEQ